MKIYINNRQIMFPDDQPLNKVVGVRTVPKILAVWVNGKPVLQEEYRTHIIHDGDRIKLARLTGEYDFVYREYGRKHFGMRTRNDFGEK